MGIQGSAAELPPISMDTLAIAKTTAAQNLGKQPAAQSSGKLAQIAGPLPAMT
jgi:hypothetical protein